MCVAVPGRVIEVLEKEAIVSFQGVEKRVNTVFIDDLQVGEYVLIHVGCALEKIDEAEALKTIKLFERLIGGEESE
ncbi:MAG: HypC/HybG/HupF family hydrogenase formation chaperone [Clostridium sp.]